MAVATEICRSMLKGTVYKNVGGLMLNAALSSRHLLNPGVYGGIGRFAAEWVRSKTPVHALGQLPIEKRWAKAEKSLSPNQQALFVKREVADLAQRPAVAINRGMIEESSLPKQVKDFLLNPPEEEGFKWGEDWTAGIKAEGSSGKSIASGLSYEAQIGLYNRGQCHGIVANCRMVVPIYEASVADYVKALDTLVEERGEFGVMGELVRFIRGAYQSRDAVERLYLSCWEQLGQVGKTVFLEKPYAGNKARLQILNGSDINLAELGYKELDPRLLSPESVVCGVEFMTSGPIGEKKVIPFSVNNLGWSADRGSTKDVQNNSVIVFADGTADLVQRRDSGISIKPASPQFLDLLAKKVSPVKNLPAK